MIGREEIGTEQKQGERFCTLERRLALATDPAMTRPLKCFMLLALSEWSRAVYSIHHAAAIGPLL